MSIDRLCFGTSTFAAGRLRPGIDSRPGIAALREALGAGVRLIHSNPNLGTQWAIRQAIIDAGHPAGIGHLVKVEIPLDLDEDGMQARIARAVQASRANLETNDLHALIVEPDLKRTRRRAFLVDYDKIACFYQHAAAIALDMCRSARVLAFCHSPGYLVASLRVELLSGCAAHYSMVEAWPTRYLDRLAASAHSFVGMAPLRRGALVNHDAEDPLERLRCLRWALGHPAVSYATITMSSPQHVTEVLLASQNPLPLSDVHAHAQPVAVCSRSKPTGLKRSETRVD